MSTYPYSVEDFEWAYQVTGMKLLCGKTLSDDRECGCPQGVLAVARTSRRTAECQGSPGHWARDILGITEQQFGGFAVGYDEGNEGRDTVTHSDAVNGTCEATDAFEVGLACRKRFLGLD